MSFRPGFCPYADCDAHHTAPFQFQLRGRYRRKCDGLLVQRYGCRTCGRRFSRQSFRINYRWWRPRLHLELARLFVSKVTMRQAARLTGAARETVARRMRKLGEHCRTFHEAAVSGRSMGGVFLMDELETFETDRLLCPVTVPVLIQGRSLFVLHAETAPLPARGRLGPYRTVRKQRYEKVRGIRKSGSRAAVEATLLRLRERIAPTAYLDFRTDRKQTYRSLLRKHFEGRIASHVQIPSKRRRDRSNPLFAINHTLAMMRDGISRLVRRSWGASKLRARLDDHLWIWIAYRNYVRPITVEATRLTPAMAAGVSPGMLTMRDVLRWRWPARMGASRRPAD